MKTSLLVLVVVLVLAPACAIILEKDAKPSTYDDLVCQLQNGSPGVCTQASNCKSASGTQQKCSGDGLICCVKSGLKITAATVGQKSREACLKSSEIDKLTQCPPIQIIPGKNIADAKQFPYMAIVGYGNKSENMWLCNGVLISENYVLTTAVCAGNDSKKPGVAKRVRLGEFDITKPRIDPNVQEIEVEKAIPYPSYSPPSLYHDIALLKLDNDIKFSATVRPACLNAFPQLPVTKVIATGFGSSNEENDFGTLRYVDLDEVPTDKCNHAVDAFWKHFLNYGVNHSSICAYGEGRDAGVGDSGGALQVRLDNPYCQYSVVGIPSFRKPIHGQAPGIYTRVSEYLQWIESIVWN